LTRSEALELVVGDIVRNSRNMLTTLTIISTEYDNIRCVCTTRGPVDGVTPGREYDLLSLNLRNLERCGKSTGEEIEPQDYFKELNDKDGQF